MTSSPGGGAGGRGRLGPPHCDGEIGHSGGDCGDGCSRVSGVEHPLDQGRPHDDTVTDLGSAPAARLLTEVLEGHGDVADIVQYRIGPSIGAYTGPGTAGLFVF